MKDTIFNAKATCAFFIAIALIVFPSTDSAAQDDTEGEIRLNYPKFKSTGEFFREAGKVPKIYFSKRKELKKMDPKFREIICLTVTFANNCRL